MTDDADLLEEVKALPGVAFIEGVEPYTRVVFEPDATAETVRQVDDLLGDHASESSHGASSSLGATQDWLVYVEYNL